MSGATSSSVLDASSLLAYLRGEPGGESVRTMLSQGTAAIMNAANYAEVLSRLADAGESAVAADRRLRQEGIVGGVIAVVEVTADDAVAIAELRTTTRALGLSLGDRACLATALRLRLPVITADRVWAGLSIGVAVRVIRP